ncbi:YfhO family protein [Bacillus cereus]
MKVYKKKQKKLTENRLENIYYKNNYLKGDIKSNKDGLLYLSVPYSKGWTIKIDGKETEFTKANSAFIGVPITKRFTCNRNDLRYTLLQIRYDYINHLTNYLYSFTNFQKSKSTTKIFFLKSNNEHLMNHEAIYLDSFLK